MNTYLIVSETIYHINKKIKELTQDITNIITFTFDNDSIDNILEEASYYSMFNDKKCIIVKNAKFLSSSKNNDTKKNKEINDKILKYLEEENKNTRLIFITDSKVDKKRKLYNILLKNNHVFTYPSLTRTEVKNELYSYINNTKYKIDDNSLWYIINATNGNFDLAINELNKIMLYYSNPTYIKYEDVVNLTSKLTIENNFKLVDAIIKRDLDNSLLYLNELKILKIDPSIILALIYREFRLMLSVLLYEKNKYKKEDILSNLSIAPWQYDKIKDNLRLYNEREIKEEIVKLSDLDYKLKSGKLNKDIILNRYIIDLCL